MGRMYTATMNAVSVSTIAEIFAIMAPADSVVVVHEICIARQANSCRSIFSGQQPTSRQRVPR